MVAQRAGIDVLYKTRLRFVCKGIEFFLVVFVVSSVMRLVGNVQLVTVLRPPARCADRSSAGI